VPLTNNNYFDTTEHGRGLRDLQRKDELSAQGGIAVAQPMESNMIELVFVVCLRTMPHLCEERSLSYVEDISLMNCMMQAQPQLAQWSASNPDLEIARWRCQSADRRHVKA
jgi:hypothetical protein